MYAILIVSFIIGFRKVRTFESKHSNAITKFSIVIPFRNEAPNLPGLLGSIYAINYPRAKFEVLLVDDESSDNSVEVIQDNLIKEHGTNVRIIKNKRLTRAPKKDAISRAIKMADFEWILTTDADCILPENWLKSMDAFIQSYTPNMVVAPVSYDISNSFLGHFQYLDFLSLQSATISGFGLKRPFLCNGANFAYQKAVFYALHGFEGNSHIASGDDLFLMEKAIKTFPKDIHYLNSRDALVITGSQPSLNDLLQQRRRWVAKMTFSKNTFGKMIGLIILFMNAFIIITALFTIIGTIKIEFLILVYALKFVLDLLHIRQAAHSLA